MTPAIQLVKNNKVKYSIHSYDPDPNVQSYGLEASTKLGVAQSKVFKTLIVELDSKELVVAVIPVSAKLSMKLMAKALISKKASMADQKVAERSTGYVLGGISPLGQKKPLRTIVDESAKCHSSIYISAGKRGLEIELCADKLVALTSGLFSNICQ